MLFEECPRESVEPQASSLCLGLEDQAILLVVGLHLSLSGGICLLMDSEILKPETNPKASSQALSTFGCFLAAAGATLLTFCLVGAATAASVWAFCRLMGLPDIVVEGGLILSAIPVLAATFWTAGRAWHVEQRLAQGLDVDQPVFALRHYLLKRS